MRFFFGLCCLVWTAAAWSAEAPTLLVFGDSLSAGYGLRAEEAWPVLLQQKLGPQWHVVNASVSGETTGGGLTRLPAALAAHHPRVVLIELGANDGLRGLPIAEARANLAAMIEKAQASGARPMLIAIRLPPNFGAAYTTKFAAMFDQLAEQYKLPKPPFLLDRMADKPDLFQPDQLHPIAQAEPMLLDNVMVALSPLLKTAQKTDKAGK